MNTKKSRKSLIQENYIACLIVGIMALFCLFPFWVALINSFGDEVDITINGFAVFPRSFSLESYKYLINNKGNMLLRAFGISFIVVVIGTVYTLVITVTYAYAIAQDRNTFPFANVLSFFAWFTTVFSGGIIPWYILTTQYYGLSNNIFALFVPSGLNVFNMYVIRNSFKAVPKELTEAAKIDGASNLKIFLRIALPLSRVGIVTITLFTALQYWNDFHLSLYLITKSSLYPVQKMLYSMMANITFLLAGSESTATMDHVTLPTNTAKMVMTVLTIIPVAIVFPFAQKYFVKGITVGAVKQ